MIDEPDLILAVITKLKASTKVTAITSTRIYRKGEIPSSPTLPYIVVSPASDVGDDDTSTSAYAAARVQCSSYASSDMVADKLSKTIRQEMCSIRSTVLTAGTGSVYVISIFDAGDTPDENTDIPEYMHHRDLAIRYNR